MTNCNWIPAKSKDRNEYCCPFEIIDGHEECIFHMTIEEKEKNDELNNLFVSELKRIIKDNGYNFIGFKFPGGLDWRKTIGPVLNAQRLAKADFRWAEFGDNINLKKVIFQRGALFSGAIFHGKVDFSEAAFNDKTGFENATFKGISIFNQIKTSRKDTLDYGSLEGGPFEVGAPWLIFNKTVFNGPTMIRRNDLSNARFQSVNLSNVSFIDSKINKTRFIDCEWGKGYESSKIWLRKNDGLLQFIRFRQTRLLFDELLLRKSKVKNCNDQSQLKKSVDKVEPLSEIKPSDIEILCLQLKQSMESMRDPITAGDFHFCAMEMRRMNALDEWQKNRKILRFFRAVNLWIYKTINGYGERYGRTLLWLACLILASSLFYFVNDNFAPNGWSAGYLKISPVITYSDYLLYAVQNVLPLKFGQQFIFPQGQLARWISFFETFFGTTLFAFLILALRRRFKR